MSELTTIARPYAQAAFDYAVALREACTDPTFEAQKPAVLSILHSLSVGSIL